MTPRSRADEFREAGLCECGCNRRHDYSVESMGDLTGARIAQGHYKLSISDWPDRIRANRATHATQESDSAWLKRTVDRHSGLNCEVQLDDSDSSGDLRVTYPGKTTIFYRMPQRGRDEAQVIEKLRSNGGGPRGWPLLGVNTMATSDEPLTEEEHHSPAGVDVCCEPELLPKLLPKRCGECFCAATPGYDYCVYCQTRVVEPTTRNKVDSDPRNVAAAQRLAALEKRERRLNPVTATQRELAKRHPWECDDV